MKKKYSSADIQKMFHISRPALRYYMDKGLIGGEKDDKNGYLSFSEKDMEDLMDVQFFRQVLDFSTKEIEAYMCSESVADQLSVYFIHKELLKREIEKRKMQLEILTFIESTLELILKAENDIELMQWDTPFWVLEEKEPQKKEDGTVVDFFLEKNLICPCNIFKMAEDGEYAFFGFGAYVEWNDLPAFQYDKERCVLKKYEPGLYLYGTGSWVGDYRDPAIMQEILDYAKAHDLELEDTVYSMVYYIDRTKEERKYYYDLTIPIKK